GHSQFLTKAQGMPKNIEATLTKMIRNFIWGEDKQPRLAMEILQKPLKEGGLSLLDVKARNEAIEIGWLKTYLNFSPTRPTWATVTDLTIAAAAPPGLSPLAIVNCFLQNWPPPTRGPRATKLGHDIARMLKTAKKYGTSLVAICYDFPSFSYGRFRSPLLTSIPHLVTPITHHAPNRFL
ncbi:hypothetical protein EDB87DRAFT_1571679, partial [Lactarius vividus]